MKLFSILIYLAIIFVNLNKLNAENLLIVSNEPKVLDGEYWKNYFRGKSWKSNELLEADNNNLFIYLNSYRIPKGMDWKKPAWGLWNLKENNFTPLIAIPSNLIPIRKIGNRIFLKNKNNNSFYKFDLDTEDSLTKIISSSKLHNWFPRADGSVVYIIEDEDCQKFTGSKNKEKWSICVYSSDFLSIEKLESIEACASSMLAGDSDNFILFWYKNKDESIWNLDSFNSENKKIKNITKSPINESTNSNPPTWLSWIENNWVIYESIQVDEVVENSDNQVNPKNKSFILQNIENDKRRKVLLDNEGILLLEIGNNTERNFSYNPYLIVLDVKDSKNRIKVIDVNELRVLLETYYPFDFDKYKLGSVYYP
jgi:hypothetical protein